jgi:hypothetical protein
MEGFLTRGQACDRGLIYDVLTSAVVVVVVTNLVTTTMPPCRSSHHTSTTARLLPMLSRRSPNGRLPYAL